MKILKCICQGFNRELKEGNYYFVEADVFGDVYYISGSFGVIGFGKQNFVSI